MRLAIAFATERTVLYMQNHYNGRADRGGKSRYGAQSKVSAPAAEPQPVREEGFDPSASYVEGRHAVMEVLKSGRTIDKLYIQKGINDGLLAAIKGKAAAAGVVIAECDRRKLDYMSATGTHQGVIASVAEHEYVTVEAILKNAEEKGEKPLIVICDSLADPHNLGAIIRTASAAGAHGVIIPKRRSVGLTAVVAKSAAGALEHMPVARVTNLTAAIKELKEKGVWVFGTAAGGQTPLFEADLGGASAIIIGNEGDGMGKLIQENCDFILSIPMKGEMPSLNASAAAAIVLFEAVRRRM